MEFDPAETTQLLLDWAGGDRAALGRLTPRVYKEMRRIAQHLMQAETGGRTLQATALVHEAFLRLAEQSQPNFDQKAHFLSVAAKIMRQILLDQARRRHAAKRGGRAARLDLEDVASVVGGPAKDQMLIALDEALEQLAAMDPRKAQIVELRYFGGVSIEETAAALGVSEGTVMRDWRLAKAWLASQIQGTG